MQQSKTSLFHEYEGNGFYLAQFKTPELAIFSYYLQSSGQALLIDPTFDVYPYEDLAKKRNGKIISVLLTHYHADFIAGHSEFNLPIIMGPKSSLQNGKLKIYEMKDQYTFNLGAVWLKILHTPGHTPESSCYRLLDKQKKQVCLFTGDTVFLGEVGRPDLAVSSDVSKQQLASMLFDSIQNIKNSVNAQVRIYPGHGAGSSCGKSISDGNFCTLQKQKLNNYALKIQNKEQFVNTIISGMPKSPQYFFHDATMNKDGHNIKFDSALFAAYKSLSMQDFKKQIKNGCVVIDSRQDFQKMTIKGGYLMPEGGPYASWVGMMISPKDSLLLVCTTDKQKDIIQRMLRIGYHNIKGYAGFTVGEWKNAGNQTTQFDAVNASTFAETADKTVLDVRNLGEWKAGIVQNAKLLSLPQLKNKWQQVKQITNLYVHCRTGGRARLASSILAHNGIKSTIVADICIEFEQFEGKGLKIVPYNQQ